MRCLCRVDNIRTNSQPRPARAALKGRLCRDGFGSRRRWRGSARLAQLGVVEGASCDHCPVQAEKPGYSNRDRKVALRRYAGAEEQWQLDISGLDCGWIVPHTADTNVAGSRCAYDRIMMDRDGKEDYAGVWGVDQGFSDKRVPDYVPSSSRDRGLPGSAGFSRARLPGSAGFQPAPSGPLASARARCPRSQEAPIP